MFERRPSKPAVDPAINRTGLYPDEQSVMDKLMDAYREFLKLDRERPDELRDFVDGIHRCQDILGIRVLRRSVPTGWPTYQNTETIRTMIDAEIPCPGCKGFLMRRTDGLRECVNQSCSLKGRRFKAPTIEIELIPEPKEAANAVSRDVETPGVSADV